MSSVNLTGQVKDLESKLNEQIEKNVNLSKDVSESKLIDSTREFIAGYKLPKKIIIVEHVQRAPNGKADYKWANEIANKV